MKSFDDFLVDSHHAIGFSRVGESLFRKSDARPKAAAARNRLDKSEGTGQGWHAGRGSNSVHPGAQSSRTSERGIQKRGRAASYDYRELAFEQPEVERFRCFRVAPRAGSRNGQLDARF